LLGNFFRLWFAIRRTATTEHIVGEDTLDMTPETEDRSYPLFGKVPLPSVMIQQLDMILTLGILDPLRKQVLEDFQKLALVTNPRNWMTIYLITFMSLHSCAKITDENYRNARKHGLLVSQACCCTYKSEPDICLAEICHPQFRRGTPPQRQCISLTLPLPDRVVQPVQTGLEKTAHDTIRTHVCGRNSVLGAHQSLTAGER
jgi:hypothetical protein